MVVARGETRSVHFAKAVAEESLLDRWKYTFAERRWTMFVEIRADRLITALVPSPVGAWVGLVAQSQPLRRAQHAEQTESGVFRGDLILLLVEMLIHRP